MKGSRRAAGESKARPPLELEKSAGAVVFHRGEAVQYLLIYSTYWEFPKGLIEPDETETEAAVREVREETGLSVALLPGFRHEINYFYRRTGRLVKKSVVYFLAGSAEQDVRVSWEHREARWLTYPEALEQIKYANSRELLEKANRWLSDKLQEGTV